MKFRNLGRALGFCCASACLAGATPMAAQSISGLTEKEVVVGSCSALEGPSSALGRQTVAGAKAYFALMNDEGGVHGRKLRLIAYDDSYDPAKTQGCFERLMAEKI
jgi:branched-chain amino acid transport system substrate-binding protein